MSARRLKNPMARRPPWNTDALVSLFGALQMHVVTRKSNVLSLDDFYLLARKCSSTIPRIVDHTEDLLHPELMLHEAFVCASPSLLRVRDDDKTIEVVSRTNVIAELRELCQSTSIDMSRSDSILRLIREHRKEREAVLKKPTSEPEQKSHEQPIIREGMTIEERVEARAQARTQLQDVAVPVQSSRDREWLVQLADALWSHSRTILSQKKRWHSARTTPRCVLTLLDSFAVLGKVESKQTDRATKRQVVEALEEISRVVPDFLQLLPGSKGLLDRDTTVLLHSVSFGSIRDRLLGKEPGKRSLASEKNTALPERSPLLALPQTKGTLVTPIIRTEPKTNIVTADTPLASPSKKMRLNDSKRKAEELNPIPDGQPPAKKPTLRINPHHILSDADRDGGEFLEHDRLQSPRGLKTLFVRMNAGERI